MGSVGIIVTFLADILPPQTVKSVVFAFKGDFYARNDKPFLEFYNWTDNIIHDNSQYTETFASELNEI